MSKCSKSCMPECEYFTTGGCVSPFNCMYKEESGYINSATSGTVVYIGGMNMPDEKIIEVVNALKANDKTMKDSGISDNLWGKAVECIMFLQSENAALRERLKKAVELPLECGSAVWYLNTHKSISLNENTVYEGILERYHLAPIGGKLYFIVDIRIKNDYGITVLPEVEKDYGKTWFTSREAAEARLAELKGE